MKPIQKLIQQIPFAILLSVLPVILLITGLELRISNGNFSIYAIDPEFSYLLSSIRLSQGSLNLFLDHPGTPLLILAAPVMRFVHLFRSGPFVEDVLRNPVLYLNAMNISLFGLIAFVMLIAGWLIYRRTGSIGAALFIQTSPFSTEMILSSIGRYMPEPFLIAVVICLATLLIIDVSTFKSGDRILDRRAWWYGIIAGFGLSLKITFAPVLLIPLFLSGSIKSKIKYCVIVPLSFVVFTFPLFARWEYFFNWISSIVVHSGKHGSGEANFLEPAAFADNLRTIAAHEKILWIALIPALILLLLYLIKPLRGRITNHHTVAALAGVTVASILGVLIIAKHFALYYLVPFVALAIPLLYFSIRLFLDFMRFRKKLIEFILLALVALMILSSEWSLRRHRIYNTIRENKLEAKKQIINDLDSLQADRPLILLADFWSARQEAGLFFGMLMTPSGSQNFGTTLEKLYPNTYLFKEASGKFYSWHNTPEDASNLIKRYPLM
ncbi:MAG TPA: hypothetical protein VLH16_03665, partial [Bacteroidales bacterium]|nr:hypothetical protein [Bacteroidales bacterium]